MYNSLSNDDILDLANENQLKVWRDIQHRDLLFYANNAQQTRMLLGLGADELVNDKYGRKAYFYCQSLEQIKVFTGKNIPIDIYLDKYSRSPLCYARSSEIYDYLKSYCSEEEKDRLGLTAKAYRKVFSETNLNIQEHKKEIGFVNSYTNSFYNNQTDDLFSMVFALSEEDNWIKRALLDCLPTGRFNYQRYKFYKKQKCWPQLKFNKKWRVDNEAMLSVFYFLADLRDSVNSKEELPKPFLKSASAAHIAHQVMKLLDYSKKVGYTQCLKDLRDYFLKIPRLDGKIAGLAIQSTLISNDYSSQRTLPSFDYLMELIDQYGLYTFMTILTLVDMENGMRYRENLEAISLVIDSIKY